MLIDKIMHYISDMDLLPELQDLLVKMINHDMPVIANNKHSMIISDICKAFEGDIELISPFDAAWSMMYAVVMRLDTLQDNDFTDDQICNIYPLKIQYNTIFGYYILTENLINELKVELINSQRLLRLHKFWSKTMLRMASGQQRDLLGVKREFNSNKIEYYQEIAQYKTGSMFSLAFGGTAMLLTDDIDVINTLKMIGEMYGAIIQYGDDIEDSLSQTNDTVTLPIVFDEFISNDKKMYIP